MAHTVLSQAKVNLYLRVGARRADGFHPLVSWFCSLGLADELRFVAADSGEVSMSCDRADVPCDGRNLIMKAAALLRPLARNREGVHISLVKRIPMGGGLGGGSSNGATALMTLARLWDCQVSGSELLEMAEKLGSDVPFFMQLPSALCRGRGEMVSAVAPPRARWIVLLLPAIEMPTPAVYRRFDEMGLGTDLEQVERTLPATGLATRELLGQLANDLEPPAFELSRELGELRAKSEGLLGRPVRMSGSGSTLFTLYDEETEAKGGAAMVEERLGVRAVATGLCVTDEAEGGRLKDEG